MQNSYAAQVAAEFEQAIAELEANTNNDYVLVFDNGIAVCPIENGKIAQGNAGNIQAVMTAEEAAKMPEEAWAFTPIIKNGHNQQAKIMPRQQAIKQAVANYRKLIESFSEA